MPITDEEACRRYIIVFGAPCPCEIDHPEMTQQEALAAEIEGVVWEHGEGELGQQSYAAAVASHLLKLFAFSDKMGRSKEEMAAG